MHFLVESPTGELQLVGPIWQTPAEKQGAPDVMRAWIRKNRPPQLAVVSEGFEVDHPTEADRLIPASEHPRRRHVVHVWLFRRGERLSEDRVADVVTAPDGSITLGEWRAIDASHARTGELFDPVLETMAEQDKKNAAWRRLLG